MNLWLKIKNVFFVFVKTIHHRCDDTIFLPIPSGATGGPNSFLSNLEVSWSGKSKATTPSVWSHYYAMLVVIAYDYRRLAVLKKKGVKIVQRLDGLYYGSYYNSNQVEANEHPKKIYKELADVVVFQSEYSKKQCYELIGKPATKNEVIIYNGARKDVFYPSDQELVSREKWEFITTGNFRSADMIEPCVKALDKLWEEQKNFVFTVVGPIDESISSWFDRPYIKLLGNLPVFDLGKHLRDADVFFWSFLNPNCPNSVIEAVSSGIPVVSFASGSLPELCRHQSELLAVVSEDVIQKYEDFDSDLLLEKLKICLKDYQKWKSLAVQNSNILSIDKMLSQYQKVFEGLRE